MCNMTTLSSAQLVVVSENKEHLLRKCLQHAQVIACSAGESGCKVQRPERQWHDLLSLVRWVRCSLPYSYWQHTEGHVSDRQLPGGG